MAEGRGQRRMGVAEGRAQRRVGVAEGRGDVSVSISSRTTLFLSMECWKAPTAHDYCLNFGRFEFSSAHDSPSSGNVPTTRADHSMGTTSTSSPSTGEEASGHCRQTEATSSFLTHPNHTPYLELHLELHHREATPLT